MTTDRPIYGQKCRQCGLSLGLHTSTKSANFCSLDCREIFKTKEKMYLEQNQIREIAYKKLTGEID